MPPQVLAKAQRGLVLDVNGLRKVKHIPRRCRRHGCRRRNVYLWRNFHVKERNVLSCMAVSFSRVTVHSDVDSEFGVTRCGIINSLRALSSTWRPSGVRRRSIGGPVSRCLSTALSSKLEDAWFKLRLVQ